MTEITRDPGSRVMRGEEQCFTVSDLEPGKRLIIEFDKFDPASPDPVVTYASASSFKNFCVTVPEGTLDVNYTMHVYACPFGVDPE